MACRTHSALFTVMMVAATALPARKITAVPGKEVKIVATLADLPGHGQGGTSRAPDVDVPALLHAAQDALGRNDFAAAADALKQVVEVQPTLTAAWFNLAYAYTGLHGPRKPSPRTAKPFSLIPTCLKLA